MAHNAPVVILGTTLEGWLCAAVLALRLRPVAVDVIIVPVTDEAPPPTAVATPPSVGRLHARLKLDERDVVRSCSGSFRLASRFARDGARPFLMSFGATGAPENGVGFLHYWLRARQDGEPGTFTDYNCGAAAAAAGRFAPSAPPDAPSFGFGLHLDGAAYQNFLHRCALHYGANETPAPFADAKSNSGDSEIIRLKNGDEITPALVINAAGRTDILQTDHQQVSSPSGGGTLTTEDDAPTDNASLTKISGRRSAYRISIPLQHRQAVAIFGRGADGQGRCVSGQFASTPWAGNAIALGRSAHNLEPLFDPLTSLLAMEIETLLEQLPLNGGTETRRAEYNRIVSGAFERFADLQYLYHVAGSEDVGSIHPSNPLRRKIDQFVSRGRMVTYDHEVIDADMQQQLMIGLGFDPARYDSLADIPSSDQLSRLLVRQRSVVKKSVDGMPDQRDWLTQTGIWKKSEPSGLRETLT